MSKAPQSLIDLRQYLADQLDVPPSRFGIRGVVTPRRPWGYHLGKADIYGPDGMGDRDYSVRRVRDQKGLSNASAGFDINVGPLWERKIVAHLVSLAKIGRDDRMIAEIIGPNPQGVAMRWYKPKWSSPVKARQDHDWHIHISFLRDTEAMDKRPLFEGLFPPQAAYAYAEPHPEEVDEPDLTEAERQE